MDVLPQLVLHNALQQSTMRAVSEVVWAAAHGKGVPVPNRACKLTRYLQDTLCPSGEAVQTSLAAVLIQQYPQLAGGISLQLILHLSLQTGHDFTVSSSDVRRMQKPHKAALCQSST